MLIVILTTGFLASCGEDIETLSTDSSAVDQKRIGDLTFTLQVLNMEDEPQAVFKKGENFQFQFIIANMGDSGYQLPVYWYFPMTDAEFFTLYRKTQESGSKTSLGKSFQSGANTNDAPFVYIPGEESLVYKIPWYTQDDTVYNMPFSSERKYIRLKNRTIPSLGSGEYFTGFTVHYNETDSVRMEVNFIVQ